MLLLRAPARRRSAPVAVFGLAERIDCLERARRALSIAEDVLGIVAMDEPDAFARGVAHCRNVLLGAVSDAVCGDIGRFYAENPDVAHPLGLPSSRRSRVAAVERAQGLTCIGRLRVCCEQLRVAAEQLALLARGLGGDTAGGALAAERAGQLDRLVVLVEYERRRMWDPAA